MSDETKAQVDWTIPGELLGVYADLRAARDRDHMTRYLRAGVKCPGCRGLGRVAVGGGGPFPCLACGGTEKNGKLVSGTGDRIPPADIRWQSDLCGDLPAWKSAALLRCSAFRVAAGMGPVGDLLLEWIAPTAWGVVGETFGRVRWSCRESQRFGSVVSGRHWRIQPRTDPHSPRGGIFGEHIDAEQSKRAADAAALAAGFALTRENGALLLPYPDHVLTVSEADWSAR